jgi:hypothetical protein
MTSWASSSVGHGRDIGLKDLHNVLTILCGDVQLTWGTGDNATNLCSAPRQKLAYHPASVPGMHHLRKQIFATFHDIVSE